MLLTEVINSFNFLYAVGKRFANILMILNHLKSLDDILLKLLSSVTYHAADVPAICNQRLSKTKNIKRTDE